MLHEIRMLESMLNGPDEQNAGIVLGSLNINELFAAAVKDLPVPYIVTLGVEQGEIWVELYFGEEFLEAVEIQNGDVGKALKEAVVRANKMHDEGYFGTV